MFGTPLSYCDLIQQTSEGYIMAVGINQVNIDTIELVQINYNQDTLTIKDELPLDQLLQLTNDPGNTKAAWSQDSNRLYIFLNETDYPFTMADAIFFFVIGIRNGQPINSVQDYIDIPEKDLELFINYSIKEAAQILGKPIPASVEMEIKELEYKIQNEGE
jgi:hypothetical protein